MTLAIVKVLPEPVTPRRTWSFSPAWMPETSSEMARGWSPWGLSVVASWKSINTGYGTRRMEGEECPAELEAMVGVRFSCGYYGRDLPDYWRVFMVHLTPFLLFDGNCAEAMEFYRSCLGGDLVLIRLGDTPMKDQMPVE